MEVKEITVSITYDVRYNSFTNTWGYSVELAGSRRAVASGIKTEANAWAACLEAVDALVSECRVW